MLTSVVLRMLLLSAGEVVCLVLVIISTYASRAQPMLTILDWYGGVKGFNSDNIELFKFSSSTGHYTQVVGAESDKVDYGVTSYKDDAWFISLYVCNYGPNGNYIQGQMYR